MRPARKGDPIAAHLTTEIFNKLIKSKGIQEKVKIPPPPKVPTTFLGVSEDDINPYEPVAIISPALSPQSNIDTDYFLSKIYSVSESGLTDQNWAVAQTYVRSNQVGLCIASGITWVKANVTNLSHKWLTTTGTGLVSSEYRGKAYILTPPQETGVKYCLVLLGLTPTEEQEVMTAIRVTESAVQYKKRTILAWFTDDESDWLSLPSVACDEIEPDPEPPVP